jgi:hypothetical protein
MKDKYYQPKIEEFYVGFEYELFETIRNEEKPDLEIYSDEWFNELHSNDKYWKHRKFIKKVCDKETVWKFSNSIFKEKYTPLNIENIIRVKCLDKEDFLNLGFIEEESLKENWSVFIKHNFVLSYLSSDNILVISYRNDEFPKYQDCRFQGQCKNINELKKLTECYHIF